MIRALTWELATGVAAIRGRSSVETSARIATGLDRRRPATAIRSSRRRRPVCHGPPDRDGADPAPPALDRLFGPAVDELDLSVTASDGRSCSRRRVGRRVAVPGRRTVPATLWGMHRGLHAFARRCETPASRRPGLPDRRRCSVRGGGHRVGRDSIAHRLTARRRADVDRRRAWSSPFAPWRGDLRRRPARVDLRQNSGRPRGGAADLFAERGVCDDDTALTEPERVALLAAESAIHGSAPPRCRAAERTQSGSWQFRSRSRCRRRAGGGSCPTT